MKRLNITKEAFNKSKYFQNKYGKLKFVSESGKVYKTDSGQIIKFIKEGRRVRKNSKFPFDVSNENMITPNEDQNQKLTDILGPEELYGGYVVESKISIEVNISGEENDVAEVGGTLYVLCNGDFDDDDENERWLKFDIQSPITFYKEYDEDCDYSYWERQMVVDYYGDPVKEFLLKFEGRIIDILDEQY